MLHRLAPLAPLALLLLGLPGNAHATGAVLPTGGSKLAPSAVHLAVASDGTRTTRWASLALPAGGRHAWLVPARPGALVDLAGEPLLEALDEATAVRVLKPSGPAPCVTAYAPYEVMSEPLPSERATPGGATVLASVEELSRFAGEQGLSFPRSLEGRVFRDGFVLVAFLFEASAGPRRTPVVRVSDRGPSLLPLVLTQAGARPTSVTAWVLGQGSMTAGTPVTLAPRELLWGAKGSNYLALRQTALAAFRGFGWLTESAGHDLAFGGAGTTPEGLPLPSLVERYAARVAGNPEEAQACSSALGRLANQTGRFAVGCGAGAALQLPGGSGCIPAAADLDLTLATCGSLQDDLALALSGQQPAGFAVTRTAGLIPAEEYGTDVTLAEGPPRPPLLRASGYDSACEFPDASLAPPLPNTGGSNAGPGAAPGQGGLPYDPGPQYASGSSCSGNSTVYYDTSDEPSGCSGGSSSSSGDSSGSGGSSDEPGCGGDTVGGDNDGSSSDGCKGDSDSSGSSSDSCKSDSSNDSCKSDSSQASRRKIPSRSPVSRGAILFAALALPLRRLFRKPG